MTKKEIHIKSVLKKKKYQYDPNAFICGKSVMRFNKYHWKYVESNKKQTYVHVVIYVNTDTKTATATFFTEFAFKNTTELEKYYIVYNQVKSDLKELGIELL